MSALANARSVHRGEKSLAETYWLWTALPLGIMRLSLLAIDQYSLSLMLASRAAYYVVIFGLQLIALAWLFYFGIGVFTCAKRNHWHFWGRVASFVIGISFVVSPVALLRNLNNVLGVPDSLGAFHSQIDAINAQIPKRIDGATTLEHVDYSGSEVTYNFTVDFPDLASNNWNVVDQKVLDQGCGNFRGYFESGNLSKLTYRYKSKSGDVMHEIAITGSSCSVK